MTSIGFSATINVPSGRDPDHKATCALDAVNGTGTDTSVKGRARVTEVSRPRLSIAR